MPLQDANATPSFGGFRVTQLGARRHAYLMSRPVVIVDRNTSQGRALVVDEFPAVGASRRA